MIKCVYDYAVFIFAKATSTDAIRQKENITNITFVNSQHGFRMDVLFMPLIHCLLASPLSSHSLLLPRGASDRRQSHAGISSRAAEEEERCAGPLVVLFFWGSGREGNEVKMF